VTDAMAFIHKNIMLLKSLSNGQNYIKPNPLKQNRVC
jgi:hypothetical protein